MVRAKGLEPPRVASPGPKPGASTNSATLALEPALAVRKRLRKQTTHQDVICLIFEQGLDRQSCQIRAACGFDFFDTCWACDIDLGQAITNDINACKEHAVTA